MQLPPLLARSFLFLFFFFFSCFLLRRPQPQGASFVVGQASLETAVHVSPSVPPAEPAAHEGPRPRPDPLASSIPRKIGARRSAAGPSEPRVQDVVVPEMRVAVGVLALVLLSAESPTPCCAHACGPRRGA